MMCNVCLTDMSFEEKVNKLNRSSKKVLELLLTGQELSNVELTELTKVPDTRSCIRYIRNMGIAVADYWVKSEYSRYKKYFIHLLK